MNKQAIFLALCMILMFWASNVLLGQGGLQVQVLKYIPGNSGIPSIKPHGEQIINRVITSLHQTQAVDVISTSTSSPLPVSHLLEIRPAMIMQGNLVVSKVVDTTETMTFEYTVAVAMRAELLITDLAKGEVIKTHTIQANKSETQKFDYKFNKIGWQKRKPLNDTLRAMLLEKVLNDMQTFSKTKPLEEKALESTYSKLAEETSLVPFHLFHFRVPVKDLEGLEANGNFKALVSSGLEQYGVPLNLHLKAFSVEEKTYGSTTYERSSSYGDFRYSGKTSVGELSTLVEKGGQALSAAFKAGKTIWLSPFAPYTELKESVETPTIALVLLAPKLSPAHFEMAYFSLRRDFLTTQGPGYRILDRSKFDLIIREKEQQKSEASLDQKNITQFKSLGARYILEVKFGDVNNGESYFEQAYLMRLIDVETSEVVAEVTSKHLESFTSAIRSPFDRVLIRNYYGLYNRGFDSREASYAHMKYNFREVLNRALPSVVVVDRIWEEKKEKVQALLIMGNINTGLERDQYYICRKKQVEVNGESLLRMEQIGTCAIDYGVGKGVAVVQVKKGEKAIYQAIKAGEALFCTDKADWYADKFYSGQLKKAGF